MSDTAKPKECLGTRTSDAIKNNDICKLLSIEEVKHVAKLALNEDVDSIEYDIKPYSNSVPGFLGSHYRLNVTIKKEENTVALPFFIKTVPYNSPMLAEYVIENGIFLKEIKFYIDIVPLLHVAYRDEPWAPKCYKTREDLIIFEDLGNCDYSLRGQLFDEKLVRAGLSAIARLHAASLLAEKHLGKPINQQYPDAFPETAFVLEGISRTWFEVGVNLIANIAEQLEYDSNPVRIACERIYDTLKLSRTKRNVISHGDLWSNNLMFKGDELPECLLVDHQQIRYSPLAHDVMQFLYLCTDRNFRRARESDMLQHYYDTLSKILDAHAGTCFVQIPPFTELIEGVEEQRIGAIITAAIYFPTILMSEEACVKIFYDPKISIEYGLQRRDKFVFSYMKEDPVYERRIKETVSELAELALKLDQLPKPS